MVDISRRDALIFSAALAVSTQLPAPVAAEPAVVLPPPPKPAWAVGTQDEFNWRHVVGETLDEAKKRWVDDHYGYPQCDSPHDECECEHCDVMRSLDGQRVPDWDGRTTSNADWLKAGFGTLCERCDYEISDPSCGNIVHHEAICDDCMTAEDYEAVGDLDTAADMRADAEP